MAGKEGAVYVRGEGVRGGGLGVRVLEGLAARGVERLGEGLGEGLGGRGERRGWREGRVGARGEARDEEGDRRSREKVVGENVWEGTRTWVGKGRSWGVHRMGSGRILLLCGVM